MTRSPGFSSMRVSHILRRTLPWFALLSVACGAEPTEHDDPAEFSFTEQALSASEDCDTVSANKTFTGQFPDAGHVTSNSYGTSGCSAAYRINLNDYAPISGRWDSAEYGGVTPTTQAECEKLRFGGYAWKRNSGGTTTFLDSQWRWGEWVNGGCLIPSVHLANDLGVVDNGADYRIAVSARVYNTPLNSSSGYSLSEVKLIRARNLSGVTIGGFVRDSSTIKCQSVYFDFTPVPSARFYQLYRDTFVIRNVPAEDAAVGTMADWSFDPASGTTYTYRMTASRIPVQEGSQFTGATADVTPLSNSVTHSATASQCRLQTLLERVVIVPAFPADVTPSSPGVISSARITELTSANTSTSLRGYFLEVTNGSWSPPFLHIAAHSLPQGKAAYANTTVRSQNSADLAALRNTVIAENPSLNLGDPGTQFVFMIMGEGVLGGEKGGAIINLGAGILTPEESLSTNLRALVHELGHATFRHATHMTCTSSVGAKFGYNPTLGLRDGSCQPSGSQYADRSDPMGSNVRHYSGFSKHITGFLGNIIQLRALVGGGSNVHKHRLYTSSVTGSFTGGSVPGEPSRTATQLIKFTNDRVVVGQKGVMGGVYWIEFKDLRGFNDWTETGDGLLSAGVVVQFRPAWPISGTGGVQTYTAQLLPSITEGQTWLLDEHSELTIAVTDVQDTYADITMQWR